MTGDRLTFVGHSTVLLELGGTRLLTDPLLRPRLLHARRVADPPPAGVLDGLDALLVSHLHPDHLDFRSLRGLDRGVRLVVPEGGGRVVRRRGFRDITELRAGGTAAVGGVEIEAVFAAHDGRRLPVGPRVEALGFLLAAPGAPTVYFAGDTDLHDDMSELAGRVDVALLPVGGWGPKVGEGHLDGRRAAEAAALIRPRVVIPIHWGTYLRSDLIGRRPELLTEPPERLTEEAARLVPDVEVAVLEPGRSLELG